MFSSIEITSFWQAGWIFSLPLVILGSTLVGRRWGMRFFHPRRRARQDPIVRRAREMQVLNEITQTSQAVVSSLDLDALLQLIVQQATTLLQAEGGILNLVDWKKQEDEVVACIGSCAGVIGNNAPLHASLSGWVTLHNQPQISNHVREDPRSYQGGKGFQKEITNAAFAPLSIKDHVIGTLAVVDKLGGAVDFNQADLDLLVGFANQAATSIENTRLYATERRRAEQFKAVSEVSRRLTLLLNVDEVIKQLVTVIQQTFNYYHVGIGLVEGDELVYRAGSGVLWDDPAFQFKPAHLKLGREGIGGWVAATGKPFLAPDVSREPYYVSMSGSATRSELTVPIFVEEKVIGVLDAQSDQLNAFDDTDQVVLQALAYQAGAAIENARLFHAEERRAEQFRVIGEVGRRTISATAVDEMLQQVARLTQESFGYFHVGIGLIEGSEVVSKAEVGALNVAYQGIRIPLGHGSWGWVAQHGEVLLQPDVHNDVRFHPGHGNEAIRSHICVPLRTKDTVIGVLSAASDRLSAFDASDQMVLQALAQQTAVAIENIRFHERAQQVAVMEERSRLARELHDAVTQTLFSASLIAEAVPSAWEKDPQQGRDLLQELRGLSRGALAEMRTLLLELRPAALVETRLEDLLRQLGEAASGREGIPVNVTLEGEGTLPLEVHVAMYRIAQEALNNVVKHARASLVKISLCYQYTDKSFALSKPRQKDVGRVKQPSGVYIPPEIRQPRYQRVMLSISDNGRGFDVNQAPHHRLGLGIMQERAQAIGAKLQLDSHPGEGTRITLFWEQGWEG